MSDQVIDALVGAVEKISKGLQLACLYGVLAVAVIAAVFYVAQITPAVFGFLWWAVFGTIAGQVALGIIAAAAFLSLVRQRL